MDFSFELPFFSFKVNTAKREVGINTPGNLGKSLKSTYLQPTTASGVTVNENTAQTLSAVYRAVNWCADSLSLPLDVYRITDTGRQIVDESDEFYFAQFLLRVSPNRMYTPSEWIRVMEMARLFYGNAYSEIIRDRNLKPIALRWLHPNYVRVMSDGVELYYEYNDGIRPVRELRMWDVIHVKALSFDGYVGKSPISVARDSLSVGLAQQKTSMDYYASGMKQKVILSHPAHLGSQANKNLKDSFDDQMKSDGVAVLEEGLKPYPLTIPPADSQFLESRVFTIQEVARWYGVSPNVLMDNTKANYNTLEQQSLWDIRDSVRPRARMYEQELNWKLLYNNQKVYTQFNMNALMRADFKTRFDAYALAIQNRIYNPNEVRNMEDKNGYEGGEVYENPNITPGQSTKETENINDDGK
jgi:HK97 family phage portal protein